MNALTFQTKRAHWAMTWFGIRDFRGAAAAQGKPELEHMTPARFDILYLMYLEWKQGYFRRPEIVQSELTRRLGLHRSTISKTVARMAARGFLVSQEREPGRSHKLTLTPLGIAAIEAAIQRVMGVRKLDLHLRGYARHFVDGAPGHALRYAVASFLSDIVISAMGLVLTFGIWSECPTSTSPRRRHDDAKVGQATRRQIT